MVKQQLSNKERRVIWTALNNTQGHGAKFLVQYEAGLIKKTPEMESWYNETREEFRILQDAKKEFE